MAAVASRINNSPSLSSKAMSSPKNSKKTAVKSEEQRTGSPFNPDARSTSPPKTEPEATVPTIKHSDESKASVDGDKDQAASATNAPLAPPPRPNQNAERDNSNNGGDYFSGSHFSKEPNPFENAFGSSSETPGRTQLPSVASLTSPAPLLAANTPGWPGSLRSGPLSPAMLTGPAGSNDYFSSDHHFSGSFPTPNESSLRTGLTPGGGGSMFPQPSPNSQAIFNAIQSGGATPGTLDFHRTAMHARAASANNQTFNIPTSNGATSQPQDMNIQPNLDSKGFGASGQQQQQDQFEQHDANDAANGLFMLAQARGGNRNSQSQQQYPAPQQPSQMNYMNNGMSNQMQQQHDTPNLAKRGTKNSIGSNMSADTQGGEGEYSESNSEQAKPTARSGRGKKGSSSKATNGRRKAEDTPSKGVNKRQKSNGGNAHQMPDGPEDMDSEDEGEEPQVGADGRKLTDEEKRKNFLERNRIAALKCRQRKKQWLANLQQKVEIFSTENDALAATVTQLREEIVGLKTLLLAHKDCPVSQAQGISGMAMQNIAGEPQQYANPYGMGMQGMHPNSMQQQAAMQRR